MKRFITSTATSIICLVLIWGVSWSVYKEALAYTPPILFAGIRTLFGGILIGLLVLPKYKQIRLKKHWHVYAISSLLNVIIFFGLQTIGLRFLPAGEFTVLIYLEPVLIGILAWLWLGETLTVRKVIGLILGFLGVAAVSVSGFSSQVSLLGILLALASSIGWAFGTVYTKKINAEINMLWLLSIQFMLGGLVLTGIGSITESWSAITLNVPFISGILFAGFLGIGASWILWFKLVREGEASRVAAYTFFVPLISVLTSALFLNEPFTIYLIVGLALVIAGIYLVNRTPKPKVSSESVRKCV